MREIIQDRIVKVSREPEMIISYITMRDSESV